MLNVDNLSRPGLEPVSFEVGAGRALAVTGASGAGKSLLLRAIADLDPNDGKVMAGQTERRSVPAPVWRRMVGLLPAETGWWADMVSDHFSHRKPEAEELQQIGLPGDALSWQVSRLSTGERQRLGLLRALMADPQVLLLDEPTASLDEKSTSQVEGILRKFLARDRTIVFVSHDERQVARLADAVLTLSGGVAGALEVLS